MAREDYKGIWVFAEQEHGTLHPTVFELLAKAAELKAVCGEKITAVLLGSGVRALAQELFDRGADEVILAADAALEEYSARPYQAAFTQLAQRGRPSIVLFGATPLGRDLAPKVMVSLDTGLTADAEIIQLSIMNGCGDVLMNRYFKPLYTERWDEAMEVNHITPEQVACEDPFILWADTVSSLFMDADLIVGYSTFNDIAKLHASGVVLPDKDIYLDLAEAFSLIHYQATKTITYEKLMNCAAHYGYHGRNRHDSLTDTDATLFCFQHMLDDDQAIFKKRRYPQISG